MNKKRTQDSSRLLDVSKAADFLGVSNGTIRRWTHSRKLNGIKVGMRGDWRYTKDDLEKMITKQPMPSTSATENLRLHTQQSLLSQQVGYYSMNQSDHFVQYYEEDQSLIESVSKFIGNGLRMNDFCIIVATPFHRKKIFEKLQEYGFDVLKGTTSNFTALDAEESLQIFMNGLVPNPVRFMEFIETHLSQTKSANKNIRIYGEMVAELWKNNKQAAAIELEKLWNEAGKLYSFSLYCAYPMTIFDRATHTGLFDDICTAHSRIIPGESYNNLVSDDQRLQAISILQQKAEALASEVRERKRQEKIKDEFICMASHELKTPVTSLLTYAQVLEKRFRKRGAHEDADYIQRMEVQLGKLSNLINDLLDISKMQSGKLIFTKKLFPVTQFLNDTVHTMQLCSEKHTITVTGQTERWICGDKDRIGQILINLISNAMKYSPQKDTIAVHVQDDEKMVAISVTDSGIGIDKKNHAKIFEQFFRVNDGHDNTFPGLGIGLYISQQIAHRHNGSITVSSEKGMGSRFTLHLPTTVQKNY